MTPTITARIQAKPTEDEFNNGYKMYQPLKELLQPMGETQCMRLTHVSYRNFGNIAELLDYIKLIE